MNKFLFFLFVAFTVASCGNGDSENAVSEDSVASDSVKISGQITNVADTKLYLQSFVNKSVVEIASTMLDKDGKFSFTAPLNDFAVYQLALGTSGDKIIPLTLVPGDHIQINTDFSTFATTPTITGTEWAKTMTAYMKLYSEFRDKQAKLMEKQGKVSNDELTKEFELLKKPSEAFAVNEIKKNPANPFHAVLSGAITPTTGFDNWDPAYMDLLKSVSKAYEKNYAESEIASSISGQIYQIELAYNEYVANNSGTREAPELALPNPEGKEIRLSSLRGNYVLIDFWASWCAPCRAENPNVVKTYNKYKSKGFTILSVSLDNDKEKWKKAIKEDGLVWPNHISDLKQWESPIPQLYGFNGIPHTVLVNPEGKIIATGLRGSALEQKLEEVYSKK